jgi:hypothetical protein
MPLWGNTDAANSKPILPELREVREIVTLTTANVTTTGSNTIIFQLANGAVSLSGWSNTGAIPASVVPGMYVYTLDANNALSRFVDASIVDPNDVSFYKSNNTVKSVDSANATVRFANNTVAVLASGQSVYFANAVPYTAGRSALGPRANGFSDVILVTPTRAANTKGTTNAGGSDTSNTIIGNVNSGWVKFTRKINSDGTVRFLKETLIALANPVASNVSSGNTSSNAIFGGL